MYQTPSRYRHLANPEESDEDHVEDGDEDSDDSQEPDDYDMDATDVLVSHD